MALTREALLLPELQFIRTFKEALDRQSQSPGHDYAVGILTRLSERATQHELRVQEALSTGVLPDPGNYPPWGSINCITTRRSAESFLLKIEGPGPQDSCELKVSSSEEATEVEAYVADLNKVCQGMADSEELAGQALKKQADLEKETEQMGQPPEEIVAKHIRFLRQYNEVKDVGQQLIGMLADNRGVPIASLYETEEYGLKADD